MALGIRQDDDDAESGFGLELAAGILWTAPERGLSGALQGHTLLSHGEEDWQEHGMAFSFSWEPSPSNRGPSLSLNHTMGATPSPGMEARHPSSTTNPNSGQQFEAEPAYGLPAPNERLSLTPAWRWPSPPPAGPTASSGPWRPMPGRPTLSLGTSPWRQRGRRPTPPPHRWTTP